MRRAMAVGLAVGALLMIPGASAVTALTSDRDGSLQVKAYIDGRSDLILQDHTAQWHHFDFDVPGRNGGHDFATFLNGQAWFPQWPHPGTNSFCNCFSDVFHSSVIPAQFPHVKLNRVQCRDSCTMTTSGNQVTLHFRDNPGGAAWYVVKVVFGSG